MERGTSAVCGDKPLSRSEISRREYGMNWMIVLYCIEMIIRCIVFLGSGLLAVKSKNEHKIADTVFWCTMMLIPVIQQLY